MFALLFSTCGVWTQATYGLKFQGFFFLQEVGEYFCCRFHPSLSAKEERERDDVTLQQNEYVKLKRRRRRRRRQQQRLRICQGLLNCFLLCCCIIALVFPRGGVASKRKIRLLCKNKEEATTILLLLLLLLLLRPIHHPHPSLQNNNTKLVWKRTRLMTVVNYRRHQLYRHHRLLRCLSPFPSRNAASTSSAVSAVPAFRAFLTTRRKEIRRRTERKRKAFDRRGRERWSW